MQREELVKLAQLVVDQKPKSFVEAAHILALYVLEEENAVQNERARIANALHALGEERAHIHAGMIERGEI
jgi:hypothetical protein